MKKCIVCGTDFEPKNPKGKYCSDKCKMKDARTKKKLGEDFKAEISLTGGLKMSSEGVSLIVPDPNLMNERVKWIEAFKRTEDYCRLVGITTDELIEVHKTWKNRMDGAKEALKNQSTTITTASTYDPNNNWRYKAKMGTKDK